MLMLGKLAEGKATPAEMAQLAKGRLREKIAELEPALEGRMEEHHRYLLQLQLRRLRDLDQDLKELDARIQAKLQPYQQEMDLLMGIPGVDWGGAAVIIAELGPDLKAFPSASQVSCWAGLAPGNHQSAGKRRNARVTKGNVHLKTALVEAAHAASRAKGAYLRDKFYRVKARRGVKRAAVAVAHKILVAAYHMLSKKVPYKDLGDVYLDTLNKHQLTRNLIRRLERLGYCVTVQSQAA
jgi:transposase